MNAVRPDISMLYFARRVQGGRCKPVFNQQAAVTKQTKQWTVITGVANAESYYPRKLRAFIDTRGVDETITWAENAAFIQECEDEGRENGGHCTFTPVE